MIQKLSAHVIQQIAAGEVIERPASAVKELVENALDAGARRIEVRFEEGGLQSLEVRDDGQGVAFDDLPLAVAAHATSKIRQFDDLDRIQTLGFRGEALSSMASVSRLVFRSTQKDADLGGAIHCSYGEISDPEPVPPRPGTVVRLESLFERLPVRHKFLKSVRSETLAIHRIFKRYALGFPHLHWLLQDEKKQNLLELLPESLEDRANFYFGETEWQQIKSEDGRWSLSWLGQRPDFIRGGRGQIEIFINDRPVTDRRLEVAVKRAFEGFTEHPQSIRGVLFLQGPPESMDVNVHPAKSEIKFLNADPLFSFVVKTLRQSLEKRHRVEVRDESETVPPRTESSFPSTITSSLDFTPRSKSSAVTEKRFEGEAIERIAHSEEKPANTHRNFRYLGAVDATYLVAEREGELYLFDQHALHERVLYEALWQEYQSRSALKSQRLLIPYKLKGGHWGELLEAEERLQKIGFEIRLAPSSKLEIVAAPSILKGDYEDVLNVFLSEKTDSEQTMVRNQLATIACHSAIRAHDPLSIEKAHYLLEAFADQDAVGHCPHGRPTFVRLQKKDLEKMFHRI